MAKANFKLEHYLCLLFGIGPMPMPARGDRCRCLRGVTDADGYFSCEKLADIRPMDRWPIHRPMVIDFKLIFYAELSQVHAVDLSTT